MKRISLVLGFLVVVTLQGHAQQYKVPRNHSEDSRLFSVTDVHGNERVWFPTGFYGAALNMSSGEYSDDPVTGYKAPEVAFRTFMDALWLADLNFARMWINYGMKQKPEKERETSDWDYHVIHPYVTVSTRGEEKFDICELNDEYFEMLKREVDYAAQSGVVLQLVLFDCWHATTSETYAKRDYYRAENHTNPNVDWQDREEWFDPKGVIVPIQKKFVDRVIAEIGDRPNIIWETCNEDLRKSRADLDQSQTAKSDWDSLVGGWITAAEGVPGAGRLTHMVMPLELPEHRTVAGYHTPITDSEPPTSQLPDEPIDTMRDRFVKPTASPYTGIVRPPQRSWDLPLISDNDCCDPPLDHYGSIPREKAWAALTAGAHSDFFIDALSARSDLVWRDDIETAMVEVGRIQTFLAPTGYHVDLIDMEPHDELASVTITSNVRNLPEQKAWVYARPNEEFVIYLRAIGVTRSVTVNQLPAMYLARWFNPRDGTWISPVPAGPTFTPPEPNAEDWVLHIKDTSGITIALPLGPCTATEGSSASFTAGASGGVTPYSYRWQYRAPGTTTWTNVVSGNGATGVTTATLTINPVTADRAGHYRARITDSGSTPFTVYTNAALLTVNPASPLAICMQPQAQWVAVGTNATFTAAACQGMAPYTFQWQHAATATGTYSNHGNAVASNSPNASLTFSPVTLGHAGFYRLRMNDAAGTQVYSNAVRLSLQCSTDPNTLCLQNKRFKVQAWYFDAGSYRPAKVTLPVYSNWSGFFWFFDSTNVELGVKVLPGSNAWWVFPGAGTDVDYRFTVTDTMNFDAAGNPVKKDYHHSPGNMCDVPDFNAFPRDYDTLVEGDESASLTGGGGEPEALTGNCIPNATQLCQIGNRFKVRVLKGGVAKPAEALTTNTGAFWFFNRDNAEVFVKVLDGTQHNNFFWVYYGSQTDQPFQVEVTDTANPALPPKIYNSQQGTLCGGGDPFAFSQP